MKLVKFVDIIFPKTCLGCGKEGKYICGDCIAKVPLAKPICPYCGKPSIDGTTHVRCAGKFGLNGLISIWEYEGIIRKAILALKYKYAREVGKEISGVFAAYLNAGKFLIPESGRLVPIPIYWYRENSRGFNQSNLLGRDIALVRGWKFEPGVLIKRRPTIPQTELSGHARRQNLKGVFAVSPNIKAAQYSNVLLFDDVFTTGSTLMEAGKVLKKAGAEKVWGLTIAG